MKNQGMKISIWKIISTALVCMTLISCSKGGSQRSSEESLVLGNSSFNPGETAPGVELEPQSSTSILEQSQSSNLASFSIFSVSNSDGGYIPGGSTSTGGGDTGVIAPPGSGSTPTTTPTTTVPVVSNPTSPTDSNTTPSTPSTTVPVADSSSSGSTSGSGTSTGGSTNSTGTVTQPGGTDSGSIPGSGSVSGNDNGNLPNSNTGSGTVADNSGSTTSDSTSSSTSGGTSSSVDQSTGVSSGNDSTGTSPVADNGGLPNSGTGTTGGTDNGGIPNSNPASPSGVDHGGVPSSNTGSSTVVDNSGTTGSNTGTNSGTTGNQSPTTNTDSTSATHNSSVPGSNTGTPPVADNGSLPGSQSGTNSGTDNGSLPNSNSGTTSGTDNGSSTGSSNGNTTVTDNSGVSNSNPGTNSGTNSGGVHPPQTPVVPLPVVICHIPPGNPANSFPIVISDNAVPAHLAHGDVLGACPVPGIGTHAGNGNNPPVPPTPSSNEDEDQSCPCKKPVHTPHGNCHTTERKVTINLGRVCSLRRSNSKDLFFEEAKHPILSLEAIVPRGRMRYGGTSENPYANSQVYQQWGVLSADNQAKERFLIATFDLSGVSLYDQKYQKKHLFNISELKKKLGRDWSKAAIVASVCEDVNGDGSCYGSQKREFLSVVPATFKANRIPQQIALDVWNGRGLTAAMDAMSCDKQYSPIVLDLTGEGITLSGPEEGVQFDLNADGNEIYTGWAKGANNAFLVRDVNKNGIIDDGSELFGSATKLKTGKRAPNGFEALKDLDSNRDNLLTRIDEEWRNLRLWFDRNYDGFSQRNELERLDQYNISSINLNYIELLEMDEYGNQTRERSTYKRRVRGKEQPLLIVDIWFRTLVDY